MPPKNYLGVFSVLPTEGHAREALKSLRSSYLQVDTIFHHMEILQVFSNLSSCMILTDMELSSSQQPKACPEGS